MSWKLAPCGLVLSAELDALYGSDRPNDGTIGDTRHQASISDHNPKQPRPPGWVDARDVYDWKGLDANKLMHALAAGRDKRILYVISHGEMCSSYSTSRYPAWTWRPYSGVNGHFSHGHISFVPEYRMDTSPWLTTTVRKALGVVVPPSATPITQEDPDMFSLIRRPDGLQALVSPARVIVSPSETLIADMKFSGLLRNTTAINHGVENFNRVCEALGRPIQG